jgi:uncharacterized protein
VGGDDVRTDVGTVAAIVEAAQLPDGRWVLGTVGTRRIRVRRWLPDDPYPLAEVDELTDPPPGPGHEGLVDEVVATLRRALALQAELGQPGAPSTIDLADDPIAACYQAAAVSPLGPLDRQEILAIDDPGERASRLGTLLHEAVEVLDAQLRGC